MNGLPLLINTILDQESPSEEVGDPLHSLVEGTVLNLEVVVGFLI